MQHENRPRKPSIRIAILGEFLASRPSRASLGSALEHSVAKIGIIADYDWITSEKVNDSIAQTYDGLFIGPGDPTEDVDGILRAITSARNQLIPCLGTCGGFQRIVTEYATNELGFDKLENAEIAPDAVDPFFSQLRCSLVRQEAEVELMPDSLAARIYGSIKTLESFFCGYGINDKYLKRLQSKQLKVTGYDSSGEARIVEHLDHPFFMGTLYVPQVRSTPQTPHPIITAFVEAAALSTQRRAKLNISDPDS